MRSGIRVSLLFVCLCGPLAAQNRAADCNGVPDPIVERQNPAYQPTTAAVCASEPAASQLATGIVSARVLAYKPAKPARKYFERGIHAWRRHRIAEARAHLSEAIRLDPKFVEAQAELGVVFSKTGEAARGLELFDHA